MNLVFDNPISWLMLAALVPLIVHLMARARPKDKPLSSIVFLQELLKRQSRTARPKDWVLLLLRTLACACVAAAFLLPMLRDDNNAESGNALVILLDDTASMSAADGQQVRMHQGISVAENAVKALSTNDAVNLITTSGLSRALFDRPETAQSMVLRELGRIQSSAAGSIGAQAALSSALAQIKALPEGVQGELLVISDFQESDWEVDFTELLPADKKLPLRFVSVAQSDVLENTAITSMSLLPSRPMAGQDCTLTLTLQRTGAHESMPASVNLAAGDLRLSQPCTLPAEGEVQVQFVLRAPERLSEWVITAETDSDAYPGDDKRHLVVPLPKQLSCEIITQDRSQMGFLVRALENIPFLKCMIVSAPTNQQTDFVVWQSPTADDIKVIEEKARAGSCVLIVPDLRVDRTVRHLFMEESGDSRGEIRSDGGSWKLKLASPDDPSFQIFDKGSLQSLWNTSVYSRIGKGAFGGEMPARNKVLISYEDNIPALMRRPMGHGTLMLWNMPTQLRDHRWGFSPLLLPMVAETLLQARGVMPETEFQAGVDVALWEVPAGINPDEVKLFDSKGNVYSCEIDRSGAKSQIRSTETLLPELYEWKAGDDVLHSFCVNFPRTETVLRRINEKNLPGEVAPAMKALEGSGRSRGEMAIWPWLLLAGLLFLFTELFLCRQRKEGK